MSRRIVDFAAQGFVSPIRAIGNTEAGALRGRLAALEIAEGGRLPSAVNKKPHLLMPWLADLVRDPRIVEPVRALLGPDLLCWSSMFFTKQPDARSFIAWHQDATYWGLSEPDVVTAWVALTPSTVENGCLRVIPGSHRFDQVPHRVTDDTANLLSRSQEIAVDVDQADAVDLVLAPGEMSIHHVRLIHGSAPNRSSASRVGYAIRYIAAHVRQLTDLRDSATLVAGNDHGNFDHEPRPETEFASAAVAFHSAMLARQAAIQASIG